MSHSFNDECIVIKHRKFKDADSLITIFSRNHGKFTALAKGVRRLQSKKRGSLQPAMYAKVQCFQGRGSLRLIIQAQLIRSLAPQTQSLVSLTKTSQILEMLDALIPEEEGTSDIFDAATNILQEIALNTADRQKIISFTQHLLYSLGFITQQPLSEHRLKLLLEDILERPLKSKIYLTP